MQVQKYHIIILFLYFSLLTHCAYSKTSVMLERSLWQVQDQSWNYAILSLFVQVWFLLFLRAKVYIGFFLNMKLNLLQCIFRLRDEYTQSTF